MLKSSHECGRIEHVRVGNQTGADLARVDEISKVCPLQYVEMQPGKRNGVTRYQIHVVLDYKSEKKLSSLKRLLYKYDFGGCRSLLSKMKMKRKHNNI